MLHLPPATQLNRSLAKTTLFAKGDIKAAARERFDTDISRLTIVAELSSRTMAIEKGEEVEAIFVVQVQLKREEYDPKNVALLAKLIPQRILFLLVFGEQSRIAIHHGKLLKSEWASTDTVSFPIQGSNLDAIWANIVTELTRLDNLIIKKEQHAKLQKKIDALERQARREKQPKRKLKLVEEIRKLKTTT